jgi:hypothetical protein
MAAAALVSTESKHIPIPEGVMRLVRLGLISPALIPLALILLGGCATHALRCDAHLTPINLPEPAAATADVKPSERGPR